MTHPAIGVRKGKLMQEELSQVQTEVTSDTTSANDDFDNWEAEDMPTEETQEQNIETEQPVETVEQPVVEEPFLKVNFLKEEKGLTREEAKDYAEKGMNYDRLRDKYNNLNAPLEKLAKMNGKKSVDEFLDYLSDVQYETSIEDTLDGLRNDPRYEGVNPDVLREIAETRVKSQYSEEAKRIETEQQEQDEALRLEVKTDVENFQKEFPDVDISKLPQEVMDGIAQGMNLQTSYYKYLWNESAKQNSVYAEQAKVNQINQDNRNRSYGNTDNAGTADNDDFLAGWNDD